MVFQTGASNRQVVRNLLATKRFNHNEHKGKEAVLLGVFGAESEM